jgi:threonine dehydratase
MTVADQQDRASLRAAVSLDSIRAARAIVAQTLTPTPLLEHPLLSEAAGLRLLLKHENHLPTGAFKVRGGLNFMHGFAAARTHRGVITATRGNHGQSVALAATRYGVPSAIVVPFGNNPEKNAATRAFGARLIEFGRDFDEAREEAERLARAENLRYIHSANEPALLNGVGTYALEIIEAAQARGARLDAIFVPIGLGSGICGVITAFRALSPETKIYGVQAERAPSIYLSWQAGRIVETPAADTFADGVATRVPAWLTFEIIKEGVDEIVLVSEEEIAEAIKLLWRTTHNLVEGAGATATAATLKLRARLQGQTVVNVLSGGNLDSDSIGRIFSK